MHVAHPREVGWFIVGYYRALLLAIGRGCYQLAIYRRDPQSPRFFWMGWHMFFRLKGVHPPMSTRRAWRGASAYWR